MTNLMRMNMNDKPNLIIRRYTFKMYPNAAQIKELHKQRWMMTDLWNAALQMKEDYYYRERKTLSGFVIAKQVKDLRREFPEWGKINSATPTCVIQNLEKAFAAFFRRLKAGQTGDEAGYPKYRERPTNIPFRNNFVGWKFKQNGKASWLLTIMGVEGIIRCRGTFPQIPLEYCDSVVMWREGNWWLSVVVKTPPRIHSGDKKILVNFDLLDEFAHISADGGIFTGVQEQQIEQPNIDELKSNRDRRYKKFSLRWKRETRRIGKIKTRERRRKANYLHNWSTDMVRQACDVTVVAPESIKEFTTSPHGNEKEWGAITDTVSKLNKNTLNQAPALAISMLSYKSNEAGIRYDRINDESPKIAIGRELVKAGKINRRLKHKVKEVENV